MGGWRWTLGIAEGSIQTRSRSPGIAADAKLENTSLSTGVPGRVCMEPSAIPS